MKAYKMRLFVVLVLLVSFSSVAFSQLDRGHSILLEKGFQIQGLCSPQMWGGTYPPVPPVQKPNMARFLESNFTGLNLLGNSYAELYFDEKPDIQWGRWADFNPTLRTEELPYLSGMVSFEYNDEVNIADFTVLQNAHDWLLSTRSRYPGVISFLNQYGGQNTVAELQTFMEFCKPDMVCFDVYPFGYDNEWQNFSNYTGAYYYSSLYKYRNLGLAGNDGTGASPIPYSTFLQTYVRNGHTPSESEMRLNMFSAMTFGYTFLQAFTYTSFWDGGATPSILFTGADDQNPTTKFYEMAEINREARNVGSTLVRLLSTDIRVIKGTHAIDGGTDENNVGPVPVWDTTADPYIKSISATYINQPTVRGDVFVGYFKPLVESDDGADHVNEIYFMVFNGQCAPTEDSYYTRQNIRINFDFGSSGITSLQRLNRDTGSVETVTLISDGGSLYHLDLTLPGGTADLFKFNTGAFFVRKPGANCGVGADLNGDCVVNFSDFAVLSQDWLKCMDPIIASCEKPWFYSDVN